MAPRITFEAKNAKERADRDAFVQTLALYDRPEEELHQRVLDADVDVDAFVEGAFGNATIPPL